MIKGFRNIIEIMIEDRIVEIIDDVRKTNLNYKTLNKKAVEMSQTIYNQYGHELSDLIENYLDIINDQTIIIEKAVYLQGMKDKVMLQEILSDTTVLL